MPKMIRVTQRLNKEATNLGLVDLDPKKVTEERFSYGVKLLPQRGPATEISPRAGPSDNEDTTSEMTLSLPPATPTAGKRTFCKRDQKGGLGQNGGIVCMLDADSFTMTQQLTIMMKEGFFSTRSG